MNYQINTLHPIFAAEMTGFDLDADIAPRQADFIEDLMG